MIQEVGIVTIDPNTPELDGSETQKIYKEVNGVWKVFEAPYNQPSTPPTSSVTKYDVDVTLTDSSIVNFSGLTARNAFLQLTTDAQNPILNRTLAPITDAEPNRRYYIQVKNSVVGGETLDLEQSYIVKGWINEKPNGLSIIEIDVDTDGNQYATVKDYAGEGLEYEKRGKVQIYTTPTNRDWNAGDISDETNPQWFEAGMVRNFPEIWNYKNFKTVGYIESGNSYEFTAHASVTLYGSQTLSGTGGANGTKFVIIQKGELNEFLIYIGDV